jgi:hypothetical protein
VTEDFNHNITVIERRWPKLSNQLKTQETSTLNASLVEGLEQTISINNIQLSSRHNRKKEAQLLASQCQGDPELVNIYGTGLGDLQRELLSNKKISLLRVFILNQKIFTLILQHTSQGDWLSDPRVELISQDNSTKIEKPFIVITPELKLADQNNAKLCDHLSTEIQQKFIYKQHQSLPPEVIQNINENRLFINQDHNVSELFNRQPDCHVLIVGSGPSLEITYPLIIEARKNKNTIIIAVDTALKALATYCITPDIAVSIDHEIEARHLKAKYQQDIKLVYFPCIGHCAVSSWQGPRYTAYSSSPLYDEICHQQIKERLYVGGSVIHPATDLAVQLGASSITFFGCDFSFPNDKTHAVWHDQELDLAMNKDQCSILNGYKQPVSTVPNFRSYLCILESYIAKHSHINFYNSSREGANIAGTEYAEKNDRG